MFIMNLLYGLVLQACIVLGTNHSCKNPVPINIYESHNECAIEGYLHARELHMNEFPTIPQNAMLSVKFWCEPVKKQTI